MLLRYNPPKTSPKMKPPWQPRHKTAANQGTLSVLPLLAQGWQCLENEALGKAGSNNVLAESEMNHWRLGVWTLRLRQTFRERFSPWDKHGSYWGCRTSQQLQVGMDQATYNWQPLGWKNPLLVLILSPPLAEIRISCNKPFFFSIWSLFEHHQNSGCYWVF